MKGIEWADFEVQMKMKFAALNQMVTHTTLFHYMSAIVRTNYVRVEIIHFM